jgi:putative transposase
MSGEFRYSLELGTRIHFEGDDWLIVGMEGAGVQLRSEKRKATFLMREVTGSDDFRIVDANVDLEVTHSIFGGLDDLPPEVARVARERAEHVREAVTGFKSGNPNRRRKREPRASYDGKKVKLLEERLIAKAEELGIHVRTLKEWKSQLEKHGERGLVDRRYTRPAKPRHVDSRVLEAIEGVREEHVNEGTITRKNFRRHVMVWLKKRHPDAKVVDGEPRRRASDKKQENGSAPSVESVIYVPRETKFNEILADTDAGRRTFGHAKQKRSIAARGKRPHGNFEPALRPGSGLVFDSSPLDVLALDPITGAALSLDLLLCLDLCTSSIAAFRLTTLGPSAIDATLTLIDAIVGRPLRRDWPQLQPRYFGLPEIAVFDERSITSREKPARSSQLRRTFPPDMVVTDHALIYQSATFENALDRFGITLQLGRIKRPGDRPHIEAIFNAIRQNFAQQFVGCGYKGGDVLDRPADAEAQAIFYPEEIEERFEWWIENYWQTHVPEGRQLSPNEAYDVGIAAAGRIDVPPTIDVYFELLPKTWREITERGVNLDGLVYDGPVLRNIRGQKSPYQGEHRGLWPIAVDTRNLAQVWLRDPEEGTWQALERRGSRIPTGPFNDVQLRQAKEIVKARGGTPANDLELSYVLDEMLELIDNEKLVGRERRKAAEAHHDTSQAARDLACALEGKQHAELPPGIDVDEPTEAFAVDVVPADVGVVDFEADPADDEFFDMFEAA